MMMEGDEDGDQIQVEKLIKIKPDGLKFLSEEM